MCTFNVSKVTSIKFLFEWQIACSFCQKTSEQMSNFGRFSFLNTKSEPNFGFQHIPTSDCQCLWFSTSLLVTASASDSAPLLNMKNIINACIIMIITVGCRWTKVVHKLYNWHSKVATKHAGKSTVVTCKYNLFTATATVDGRNHWHGRVDTIQSLQIHWQMSETVHQWLLVSQQSQHTPVHWTQHIS